MENLRKLQELTIAYEQEVTNFRVLQENRAEVLFGRFRLVASTATGDIGLDKFAKELMRNIIREIDSKIMFSRNRTVDLLCEMEKVTQKLKREILCSENENESEPCSKTSSELVSPSDTSPTKTTSKLASISTDVFTDITNGP